MNDLIVAFSLGLAGSLHCVGMCSPLVLAVTASGGKNRFIYNAGRILTYSIYGFLVASLGNAFQWTEHQDAISLALGIFMLLMAIAGFSTIELPLITPLLQRISVFLRQRFSGLMAHRTNATTFLMGTINGMLPCGLTYLALTYCVTLPYGWQGITFMLAFGTGTLGVMLGLTSVVATLVRKNSIDFRKVSMVLLLVMGTFFIGRTVIHHLTGYTPVSGHRVDAVCR